MIETRVNPFSRIYALTVLPACANLPPPLSFPFPSSSFPFPPSSQCVRFFSPPSAPSSSTWPSPLTPSGSTMIGTTAPGWSGVLAQSRLRVPDHVRRMLDSASVGADEVSSDPANEVERGETGMGIKGKTVYPDLARWRVSDWPVAYSQIKSKVISSHLAIGQRRKLTFTSTDNDYS